MALVDGGAHLEQHAAANPQKLNGRTSIVDLLKLLEIDSSFTARKGAGQGAGLPRVAVGGFGKDEHLTAQA
ncbi:uncharacterized protein sS8_0577 [Methylocaldum marinum]|uniref:DUF3597 domain-containing protein n=1 Tax=Methylocaldum marinum TaxID=1432792 RepID=A0A250KLT7_9GAMM|nr:uncharacterized protein sS8_0577 [Methylocaldum marinum]